MKSLLLNAFNLCLHKKLYSSIDPEFKLMEGPRGPQGDRGEKGIQGEKGSIGRRGPMGLQGPAGDISNLKKEINNLTSESNIRLNEIDNQLSQKILKSQDYIEQFEKKFKEDISKNIEEYKRFINTKVAAGNWASSPGGGSVKILDNDDVEFTKAHLVAGNSILIFDSAKQKFVSEELNSILERLRVDLEVQYDRLVDVEGSFTYIGEADPGTATSSALWRIKRVYETNSEGDIEIIWANGSSDFDKVWDDRATYSY